MNEAEFLKAFTHLCKMFNKDVDNELAENWYIYFKNYSRDDFRYGVIQAVSTLKYFPSVVELKEIISKMNNPELELNADEEFTKVREGIRKYSYLEDDKLLSELNSITAEAVKRIGLNDLRTMKEDQVNFYRSSFKKAFDSAKEYQIKEDNILHLGIKDFTNKFRLTNKIGEDEDE